MKSEKELQKLKREVIKETNRIRTNPKSYIPILEEYLKWFDGNILDKPGSEIGIETQEGAFAYHEAINFLKSQRPISELKYDEEISKASQEYANEIGIKGNENDENDENLEERLEKYIEWDVALSENIDFGGLSGEDVIINLLVDDGVEDRCHRNNLFNIKNQFFGVGTSNHKDYDICTVIDYIGDIIGYTDKEKNKNLSIKSKNKKQLFDIPIQRKNLHIGNKALDTMMNQARKKERAEFLKSELKKEDLMESNNIDDDDNPFNDDPDAPDNCIRRKTRLIKKNFEKKSMVITIKTYTLDDGSEEVVTIEETTFDD
jgi:uncharacterized protein YkwD